MTELRDEGAQLRQEVKALTRIVLKNKIDDTWIPEPDAAEMLGFNDPRTLRRKVVVKGGAPYPFSLISYRCTNGRKFQYNRKDLMKFKNITSTSVTASN
jgi:hypothetical protein